MAPRTSVHHLALQPNLARLLVLMAAVTVTLLLGRANALLPVRMRSVGRYGRGGSTSSTLVRSASWTGSAASTTEAPCRTMIICGPSGAGKGTVIARLLELYPQALSLSVSHTTRAPRPGEVEGVHYHFVPLDRMRASIERQAQPGQPRKFLEYAEVHGNFYGTSMQAVERIWQGGRLAVLDVDTHGVTQIKQAQLAAKYVFLLPPDMPTLLQRLETRNTETATQIATRMRNAENQIAFCRDAAPGTWDLVLENARLDECVARLAGHMRQWFPNYMQL